MGIYAIPNAVAQHGLKEQNLIVSVHVEPSWLFHLFALDRRAFYEMYFLAGCDAVVLFFLDQFLVKPTLQGEKHTQITN